MPIGLTWEEWGRPRCRTACGETQRVGIARAIVLEPSVLFLDEPTAFVDEKSKTPTEEII
jgi:ABC-type ATPase involved in cell division